MADSQVPQPADESVNVEAGAPSIESSVSTPLRAAETRRVWRLLYILGIASILVVWVMAGPVYAGGFAIGASVSALNFHWLKRTVDLLGSSERRRKVSASFLALRYLILGATAYATLTFLKLSVNAALAGLLLAPAAVILEIIVELSFSD